MLYRYESLTVQTSDIWKTRSIDLKQFENKTIDYWPDVSEASFMIDHWRHHRGISYAQNTVVTRYRCISPHRHSERSIRTQTGPIFESRKRRLYQLSRCIRSSNGRLH